ncbi:MAG: DUF4845 domain-containing protein [Gallionella sp.]|nr:DUF4845 domain-containing protein [Gallionella sp.]MDD4947652.1 DUF4845 domain-containing protein [Gallionella sp.]MDD5612168.1 DUF4845 domain-containing protein [Gallionella sp.]
MKIALPVSQRGLSFWGFLLGAFILVLISITALKAIPAYVQNAEIKQILVEIAKDTDMREASLHDLRESFNKRAGINNITVIQGSDIDISRNDGVLVLSADYAVKVPIIANVSLYLEFSPSSAAH